MNIAKALLLISACLVAGSTFAADDKTWASVACRGYGLNTSDSELNFQNAGLYNPQNNYETVICPIEMDREGGWGTTSNVDQADINVSFRMGSVPAKAGCTLYRTSGTTTSENGRAACREKSVSVRVELGGRRIITKKKKQTI